MTITETITDVVKDTMDNMTEYVDALWREHEKLGLTPTRETVLDFMRQFQKEILK